MALIKCPECGKEISSKAPHCIFCGCPIELEQESPCSLNDSVSSEPTTPVNTEIQISSSTVTSTDAKIKDKKKTLILIAAGCVVALIIIICIFSSGKSLLKFENCNHTEIMSMVKETPYIDYFNVLAYSNCELCGIKMNRIEFDFGFSELESLWFDAKYSENKRGIDRVIKDLTSRYGDPTITKGKADGGGATGALYKWGNGSKVHISTDYDLAYVEIVF